MYQEINNEEIISSNLSRDINFAVNEILGEESFEFEKLELLGSLLYIFHRRVNEAKIQLTTKRNQYNNAPLPYKTSYGNPCFFNPLTINNPTQNFNHLQVPMPSILPFNSYNLPSYNMQNQFPYQYPSQLQPQTQLQQQYPIFQPQSYQQPNFIYPLINNEQIRQHPKKKSKKSSHKKEDSSKSHKKHKNSKDTKSKDKDSKIVSFKYDGTQTFNGIMSYLTKKTDGNINDNGTISITSNSANYSRKDINYLVGYDQERFFSTGRNELATICFDFKDKLIQPESYSIKSCSYPISEAHGPSPRYWVIEVSNDKSNWEIIDEHVNDGTFSKCLTIYTFNVQKKTKKFYRYIQFRQTGNSWDKNGSSKMLILRQFEFYGKLKMP